MQKFLYIIISLAMILPGSVFAASDVPTAQSNIAKNLTYNSAVLYGTISPGTSEDNVYWFEWGIVGSEDVESFKTNSRNFSIRGGQKEVYSSIYGLSPDTQYYFKMAAENQSGTVYGDAIYFSTKKLDNKNEAVVIATTRSVINVREVSATLTGYVAPHNTQAHYWFEFGTTDAMDMTTKTLTMGRAGGAVESSLSNLIPGTVYYYRTAAENDRGVVFGEMKSFKTKGTKPAAVAKTTTQNGKVSTKATDTNKVKVSSDGIFGNIFGSKEKATSTTDKVGSSKNDTTTTSSAKAILKNVTVGVTSAKVDGSDNNVEYKITYKYNNKEAGTEAELQIDLPSTLTFAGDSTNNELLMSEGKNGANTYYLPIGDIKKGDTRTISIIAIKASDTAKIPEVTAKLAFTTGDGKIVANSIVAGVASSSNGKTLGFPTTAIVWFVILNLIVISIMIMLKAKDSYAAAKLRMDETDAKKVEIENDIKETLIKDVNRNDEVKPHFDPELFHNSPNNNPIPVKPKLADEYNNTDVGEIGLPGMEVVA